MVPRHYDGDALSSLQSVSTYLTYLSIAMDKEAPDALRPPSSRDRWQTLRRLCSALTLSGQAFLSMHTQ